MAHLLEHLHHPMMLCRFRRLNNRTHGRKRRHVPPDVTAGVIRRGLDQTTAVLHMQHAELHFVVFICWEPREDTEEDDSERASRRKRRRMIENKQFSCQTPQTSSYSLGETESPIVETWWDLCTCQTQWVWELDGFENRRIAVHVENGTSEFPRSGQVCAKLAPGENAVGDLDTLWDLEHQPSVWTLVHTLRIQLQPAEESSHG